MEETSTISEEDAAGSATEEAVTSAPVAENLSEEASGTNQEEGN